MNKKIAIIIIALIIIVTVLVLGFAWDRKGTVNYGTVAPAAQQKTANSGKDVTAEKTSDSNDADTKAITDDLNAISDDNFGENNLSDSEMGL